MEYILDGKYVHTYLWQQQLQLWRDCLKTPLRIQYHPSVLTVEQPIWSLVAACEKQYKRHTILSEYSFQATIKFWRYKEELTQSIPHGITERDNHCMQSNKKGAQERADIRWLSQQLPGVPRRAHCIHFINEDDSRSACCCFWSCIGKSFTQYSLTLSCVCSMYWSSAVTSYQVQKKSLKSQEKRNHSYPSTGNHHPNKQNIASNGKTL